MVSVVVVEDEKVLRNGLILTTPWMDYGCKIIGEAENGISGEELILKLKPDIVITDVMMPGLNGIDMIRNLQNRINAEYVILSGYADFDFAQTAIKLGVKRYLLKPLEDSKLKDTMLDLVLEVKKKKESLHQQDLYRQNLDHDLFFQEYIAKHNSDYREKYLEEALRLISEHYSEAIAVKDVAEFLEMSESSFVKMFKNKTGYTFLKYLTLYRIKNSVKFLADKRLRVCEVANMVGYADCRYFGDVFKKYLGMTPLEYRRGRY